MLLPTNDITIDVLHHPLFEKKNIEVSVLRLDKIHPIVSGNKLYKLHFFLQNALQTSHKTVLTFGGAYSNHLVATAFACNALGLKSIGIVKGEKITPLNNTLQQCSNYNMQLHFVDRTAYTLKYTNPDFLKTTFGDAEIIAEGGYNPLGAKGAAMIMNELKENNFTDIICPVGTATTIAGLLLGAKPHQTVVGIQVLKGVTDTEKRIEYLLGQSQCMQQLRLVNDYHFGGYAKKTDLLISFMNNIWQQYYLPTDFVYTAKMFYALLQQIEMNTFKEGSNIACIHTGGLQGNLSLPKNTLLF
jgi:1-aminocyclopropane-1-carboxylate deaminase